MPDHRPHVSELLDFDADRGTIRLHQQRVVILSAAALGLLRKELVDTLGADTARRLLMRFGYADGYHDATTLREREPDADPLETLRAGATLHTLEGIVHSTVTRAEYDARTGRFDVTLEWRGSYEAEQHVHHYGRSDAPVCWSLIGYVSGYASGSVGREIYFRETRCAGQAGRRCLVEGRDADRWEDALEAMRFDFRGADLGREVERLRQAAKRQAAELANREQLLDRRERELDLLRARVARAAASRQFVAGSPAMREALEMAARVAPLDTTVLVTGESGTGKEFIVRLIHDQSPRASRPFVSVNCAALTETLLESELFGHVKGAFTGAVRDKAGLFEVASGGTIFLDEVGEVAPSIQAKLLRALQEREIRRVGGEHAVKVDARVVAATNRDLKGAVARGEFREDLYFRLAVFTIAVPPLRDRREDIPALVHAFLAKAAARTKKRVRGISAEAMAALVRYRWPGNVRELEHAIERAVILSDGATIGKRELPPEVTGKGGADEPASMNLEANERRLIERALARFDGNRRLAAEALNISTVTLWRRMKQYGLI